MAFDPIFTFSWWVEGAIDTWYRIGNALIRIAGHALTVVSSTKRAVCLAVGFMGWGIVTVTGSLHEALTVALREMDKLSAMSTNGTLGASAAVQTVNGHIASGAMSGMFAVANDLMALDVLISCVAFYISFMFSYIAIKVIFKLADLAGQYLPTGG